MKIDVPPGLTELADPYDPTANDLYRQAPYKFHDLSYYKGELYLYFGVAPAVLLFWPFAALTGHYLVHRDAVLIFCTIGFLVSAGLLWALWRRYFPEVSVVVVAACAVALGLANGAPALLSWAGVYEVPISCGSMLTVLALAAIWNALHEPDPRKRPGWLAAASVAYGLAVASRPSFLFGAVILLVPVAHTWREGKRIVVPLLAAVGPIVLIGLGLMLYNARRFDNPFEFGLHYQLTATELVSRQFFGLQYLWFHFRVYFLEPARWGGRFPFIHDIALPRVPPGHWEVGHPFGVLTAIPLVWLALAAPLAARNRLGQADSGLLWFVSAVALLFGVCALTVCLFFCSAFRYEVDFLPTLMLLAVVGILGCERVLAPTLASNRIRGQEPGQVDRPAWRRGARLGWGLLLGFSVAFNLLVTLEYYSYTQNELGMELSHAGKLTEAAAHYEQALRLRPDYAEAHDDLGAILARVGKLDEAIGHYQQALRIKPDFAEAHDNLGAALAQAGRVQEAIRHFEQAVRIQPDFAEAHYNLAVAFEHGDGVQDAIQHYEQALRIKPDYAEAHNNLGNTLLQAGRLQEAISHYEQAVRINPNQAGVQLNLGVALLRLGRPQEAIGHFEQAVRLKPDYAEAHCALGIALEQTGRAREAIGHYEQALRLKPDFAEAKAGLARLQAVQ
jgi:tetratricopeptide (TPR) repeat protein